MSNDATIAKQEATKIREVAEINEAYLMGLMWSNPNEYYSSYKDRISGDKFMHKVWGFFFDLGKKLYEDGAKTYDDITVYSKIKDLGMSDVFDEYGAKKTIDEAVMIVKGNDLNIDYYYESLEKNHTVIKLVELFGNKVLVSKGKYDYNKMNRTQLMLYWTDRLTRISVDSINNYETENLYVSAEDFINKTKENSANMLKFYDSYLMNTITQGVPRGQLTMFGGFGNTGKTSIMAEKFVMACVSEREKTLVLLNEEDAHSFRQKILLSILNHEFDTRIDRKKLTNGALTDKDEDMIHKAFEKMKELMDGDESLIKVVYMEKYIMDDLENIVKLWANRGYNNLFIDTHKVTDEYKNDKRWEAFVEDTKRIHRLTRENAGGLNLRTVLTFQLADAHLHDKFLGFDAIGEGKAAKNEAAIVMMYRPIFGDEYDKLHVYRNRNKGTDAQPHFEKEKIELDKTKTYYLLFAPKNRYGANTDNGQPVLVLKPEFDFNSFKEVGWTQIARSYS